MGSSQRHGSRRLKRQTEQKDIGHANQISDADFVQEYLQPDHKEWAEWTSPKTGSKYALSLVSAGLLSKAELTACFDLVEKTSGADYRSSSLGWHPAAKKEEMRSPEMRYLLVKGIEENADESAIQGFASIMPTFENQEPVLYCYEVHLEPVLQGTGIGRHLMDFLTTMARNIPSVEKLMLTCFICNERARSFYEKLGFELDESSPQDRKLRGGRVLTSDYVILSLSMHRSKGSRMSDLKD